MKRPAVAVVGLGLIGGSLARALTRAGFPVIGVDKPAIRKRARAQGAVATEASFAQAAARAEVVVLAAPPRTNRALLTRLAGLGRSHLAITDVSSVKVPICRQAERLGLRRFVGGHPMAGRERSGFGASSADLFRGRPWILTPIGGSRRGPAAVRSLVRAVGARVTLMSPAEHDRTVAFLSHLPQIAAWALQDAARGDPVARRFLTAAGPGFADMTRLARSPRRLWREILRENRAEVVRALTALRRRLDPVPR